MKDIGMELMMTIGSSIPDDLLLDIAIRNLETVRKNLKEGKENPWEPMKASIMIMAFKVEAINEGGVDNLINNYRRHREVIEKGIDIENLEKELKNTQKGESDD